jgi:hypothetical protein
MTSYTICEEKKSSAKKPDRNIIIEWNIYYKDQEHLLLYFFCWNYFFSECFGSDHIMLALVVQRSCRHTRNSIAENRWML